jgi:hypothetical protein
MRRLALGCIASLHIKNPAQHKATHGQSGCSDIVESLWDKQKPWSSKIMRRDQLAHGHILQVTNESLSTLIEI